jgi:hypothetical protein
MLPDPSVKRFVARCARKLIETQALGLRGDRCRRSGRGWPKSGWDATTKSSPPVMKVMAIASVVGIPPVLVAGIYGMNFKSIPELEWAYGYAWGWVRDIRQGPR